VTYRTKLDACINRFEHQVNIMGKYIKLGLEPLVKTGDKKVIKFAFESLIVRVAAFIEEYLSCIVGLASVNEEKLSRNYFKNYGNLAIQEQVKKGCKLGLLWKYIATEVSFENKAKKLKRIFNHLFRFSPFPDNNTENLILDAVLIRNVILHEGSMPSENYAKQMRNQGIIIVTNVIGQSKFYDIELIENRFILNFFNATSKLASYIQEKLKKDPRFSFVI